MTEKEVPRKDRCAIMNSGYTVVVRPLYYALIIYATE